MAGRIEILVGDDLPDCAERCGQILQVVCAALASMGREPSRISLVSRRGDALGRTLDERAAAAELLIAIGVDPVSFPAEARRLEDAAGLPSGCELEMHGARCFLLPGDPAEMEAMLEMHVLPAIAGEASARLVLSTFGRSEHDVARLLETLPARPNVEVAARTRFPEVLVQIRARGESRAAAEAGAREVAEAAIAALGSGAVHGLRGATLAEAASSALRARGATLAVADETGLLGRRLAEADGPDGPLVLGVSAASERSKAQLLGVPEASPDDRPAGGEEVAAGMAAGVRRLAGSDLGLAVTGIAGPGSSRPDRPLGLVHCALVTGRGSRLLEKRLGPMARWRIEELAAATALSLVLAWCREAKEEP